MKRVIIGLVLTGLLLGAIILGILLPAWGASQLPGPPEQFKDWPRVGVTMERCPDDRILMAKWYAKSPGQQFPNAVVYEDDQGEFIWILYSTTGEQTRFRDAQWVAWFDGETYWLGSPGELMAISETPCDIPRPLREQKL